MTSQSDTTDTRPQPPKHYLMSLPLALKRIEELEDENAQLRRMVDALALRRREEVQERIEQLQDDTEYTTEED